jgi:altered-inheritance-of-mitochondria protein 13
VQSDLRYTAIERDKMGAAESKVSAPHEWKASGPSSFSHDLVDSLQSKSETDASRSRLAELQIQTRVAEELKNLQRKESEALAAAHEKLASVVPEKAEEGADRFTVSKQVGELRKKLEERKQVRALPEEVESARSEVIKCLTQNDRRPLDCWQEVENFKAEVKKLESKWVDKVTS